MRLCEFIEFMAELVLLCAIVGAIIWGAITAVRLW